MHGMLIFMSCNLLKNHALYLCLQVQCKIVKSSKYHLNNTGHAITKASIIVVDRRNLKEVDYEFGYVGF